MAEERSGVRGGWGELDETEREISEHCKAITTSFKEMLECADLQLKSDLQEDVSNLKMETLASRLVKSCDALLAICKSLQIKELAVASNQTHHHPSTTVTDTEQLRKIGLDVIARLEAKAVGCSSLSSQSMVRELSNGVVEMDTA